ncbi:GerAB/ArcD/ProY family transporter [Priestia abyssalis]|uniref:GerAB/ArcD/ProY family transporter n=1 Tax=Priestia abyssalis TaxID=1221450 RepID=UPI002E25EE60|nr:GerAB/ArcD/ProY family transporter [Priestia abyssalis]
MRRNRREGQYWLRRFRCIESLRNLTDESPLDQKSRGLSLDYCKRIFRLLFLIILFEIGSTTLFELGIKAKQDAWIVVLIASFIGSGLVWVTQFPKLYPNKNTAEIVLPVFIIFLIFILIFF